MTRFIWLTNCWNQRVMVNVGHIHMITDVVFYESSGKPNNGSRVTASNSSYFDVIESKEQIYTLINEGW